MLSTHKGPGTPADFSGHRSLASLYGFLLLIELISFMYMLRQKCFPPIRISFPLQKRVHRLPQEYLLRLWEKPLNGERNRSHEKQNCLKTLDAKPLIPLCYEWGLNTDFALIPDNPKRLKGWVFCFGGDSFCSRLLSTAVVFGILFWKKYKRKNFYVHFVLAQNEPKSQEKSMLSTHKRPGHARWFFGPPLPRFDIWISLINWAYFFYVCAPAEMFSADNH